MGLAGSATTWRHSGRAGHADRHRLSGSAARSGPQHGQRNGAHVVGNRQGPFTVVEQNPLNKAVAGNRGQTLQSTEIVPTHRRGRLGFNADDPAVTVFKDEIHLQLVPIAM